MPRLVKTDILFAHFALHVTPGLSAAARRVGAAIIDHFNKQTSQCDPGIERLARMLDLSPASIKNATAELCAGDRPLFERVIHGGKSHRTKYEPKWDRFREIVDDWDVRMKDGSAPTKSQKSSSLRARNLAVDEPEIWPQTDRSNRKKEPREKVSLSADHPEPASQRQPRKGLGMDGRPAERALPLLLPIAGGRGATKADAAEAGRQRRLAAEIERLPRHERAAAWLRAAEAGE